MRLNSVFFLLALSLTGTPLMAADDRSLSAEALYKQHCAACHGEKGDGMSRARSGLNPPPRGFTDASGRDELSRERMIDSVTHGRPGTAMVGWGNRLTGEQIEAVVDHVRHRFMEVDDTARVAAVAPQAASVGASGPGRELYKRNCASCHGDRGTGASWTASSLDPPPRDFSSEQLPRDRMLRSVHQGRPGTAMMAFGTRLSDTEIAAVVDFIRDEFMGSVPAPPATASPAPAHVAPPPPLAVAADMGLPLPDALEGDPARGGHFYMENCHVCHGRDGDGRGERASFIHPEPRDFTSGASRSALNRPALYKAISAGMRGTVMPAWRTVLNEQEIADVAEFVFQAYIDPQPGLLDNAKKKSRN